MPEDDDTITIFDAIRGSIGAGILGGGETAQETAEETATTAWEDVKGVPKQLKEFAKNPEATIMTIVLAWVVEQVWGAVKGVIGVILGIGTYLADLVGVLGSAVFAPVSGTAGGVASILLAAHEAAISTALGLGIAAPAATAVVVAGEMLLFLYLADTAVRVFAEVGTGIPILGPAFGLLGGVYRAIVRALSGLRRAFL